MTVENRNQPPAMDKNDRSHGQLWVRQPHGRVVRLKPMCAQTNTQVITPVNGIRIHFHPMVPKRHRRDPGQQMRKRTNPRRETVSPKRDGKNVGRTPITDDARADREITNSAGAWRKLGALQNAAGNSPPYVSGSLSLPMRPSLNA